MLLALETSARSSSVAVGPLEGPHELVTLPTGRSEELAPTVAALLPSGGHKLTHYAIGIGPGSFTGLRIGLCFLKGYGLVFPRPVVPVSSFRIVAEQVRQAAAEATSILVVLDARNEEFLAGRYLVVNGQLVPDPEMPDGLYPRGDLDTRAAARGGPHDLLAGEGASLLGTSVRIAELGLSVPRADTLARLASERIALGQVRELLGLEPAYLQKPTAERRRAAASD